MMTGLIAVFMVAFAGAALAQLRTEAGKREYMSHCAICHGVKGKGDGPYSEVLTTRLPDITTLSERNNGVFPADRVYRIIDGREMPKAHGTVEMPIWGYVYSLAAPENRPNVPDEPDLYIRGRVLLLIDYLYSLQARR
jgi:mono/diheme cytochrome c family protein